MAQSCQLFATKLEKQQYQQNFQMQVTSPSSQSSSSPGQQVVYVQGGPAKGDEELLEYPSADSIAGGPNHAVVNQPTLVYVEEDVPTKVKGSRHISNPRSFWRSKHPRVYQESGYAYYKSEGWLRHRDFAGRVSKGERSDRYLHHTNGYLRDLYVACTDDIYDGPGNTTWRRTYIHNVGPLKVRLATWVQDFSIDSRSWKDWGIMLARALPVSLAMIFVFWSGTPILGKRRLAYAPVLYTYYGDAKVWRNLLENRRGLGGPMLGRNNRVYRLLKPRRLCILRNPYSENGTNHGADIYLLQDLEAAGQSVAGLGYLFVAYATEHFSTQEDMNALRDMAETATRAAGLTAYWLACDCVQDDAELESDVYRISDAVRGSHGMVIAVNGPGDTGQLLREWGDRMWTFPEVLLSPGTSIKVYVRGEDLSQPLSIPKNQVASRVWAEQDAEVSRNLIDHFLGNISLSRLELAVLALDCLYRRVMTRYLDGDQAYALMGLLRLRPQIDRTDSAFQAFARLSLANDSDMLLERYICTLPLSPKQPWYNMDDAYYASLWDITPYCQVAGIAADDTVIIDGASGISVRWKSFYAIYWSAGPSIKRSVARAALEYGAIFLVLAIVFLQQGAPRRQTSFGRTITTPANQPMIAFGVIFLLLFLWIWISAPGLVRRLYTGKFREVQAEMFGFEGHLNAATVERAIFGGNFGRFTWSVNGSLLSRSVLNEFGERVGIDPCLEADVRARVDEARHARPGDMRVFTLVDTYNMELTLFEAVNPPTTLMLCASEGGMQRAVGCSYDWPTQTMYRETVLRLPTTVLDRVFRVPRFRMGIHRPQFPSWARDGATQNFRSEA